MFGSAEFFLFEDPSAGKPLFMTLVSSIKMIKMIIIIIIMIMMMMMMMIIIIYCKSTHYRSYRDLTLTTKKSAGTPAERM